MSKQVASLNPETFVDGGGLIDDIDVTFKECTFDLFDYNGKVVPGVPSLKINMSMEDDEEATQYYSMGSSSDWIPSEDGSQLMAVGKASSIKMTTNGGIFLKSLIDAGFPVDKLGDNITVLDGLQAHVIRVPAPKRPGIQKKEREDGKKFEDTILIIGEIISLPWEKGKPKGAPTGKSTGKPATKKAAPKGKVKAKPADKAEPEGDINEAATAAVLAILESDGTITKKELPSKIFQTEKENPDRNAIVKVVFDDSFLENGPWDYNDGTLISQ